MEFMVGNMVHEVVDRREEKTYIPYLILTWRRITLEP